MISHLLFVDDTLILCDPKSDQIGYLKCILLCFEAVSGLQQIGVRSFYFAH